ncbi:MAG: hypothetical protein WBE76_03700 [Terracidiphilus sp.]
MPHRILRTIALTAVVVYIAACGTAPPSSPVSPPGNSPLATNQAASGPELGAWWDPDRKGLRTEFGVAGAAYQGPPAYNDGSYTGAAVCMRKSIALLTTSSGALFSVNLPQGRPQVVATSGIPGASIAFSPSCAAALVYASGKSHALLVQNLFSTPKTGSVTLPAGVSAAAVSDSGSILVAVPGADGTAAIQLLSGSSSTVQQVTVLSRFGGMAFLPGADTALLADAAANSVFEAAHVTGNMSLAQIASEADGVSNPVAIAASADGRFAAVANKIGSTVLRLDLSGQSPPTQTACHCTPTELEPLAGNLVFRLNEAGAGTVWAFDGDASAPRVVFIPTDRPTAQAASRAPGAHQ